MSAFPAVLSAMSEGVRIAIDAVRANKVRAGLTILGIAVGVFVVVAIAAAVHGINQAVARDFASMGPTTFFVTRYPISFESCDGSETSCQWLRNPPLRPNEVDALRQLPSVDAVGERLEWGAKVAYRSTELSSTSVEGYSAEWTLINAPEVYPGRAFTPSEVRTGARVAVISTLMAERLFGDSDPLGKTIAMNDVPFEVIGVFKDNVSFLNGGDRPKAVVPITTLIRSIGARASGVALAVKPREELAPALARDLAIDDVTAMLRGLRGARPSEESSFAIITQDRLFETYDKIVGMFFLVMLVLSGVGLIVGGVGVVAIMMISVTERTREIGVRKALGATKATILWQFLVEAATLTGIGGAIGLFVGWLGTLLIRNFTPVEASIPPLAVVAALGASCITGILFGLLPASRAARLDPVEALRYE
ncbi:MAG: ABC transporter permease [Gemmatimonas sp.]|jgi:putative ABC transport system permease protein|nr:ABC transporter permease [Gemmatimonas sp.]MCA2983442.1 ABC transporter permease [Gemmatimonas sp.]MCA2986545.1 ABC transporter permease [Gemmatimonas sp.]MCA2994430.1 ABC transporter permease [Gemmatimonas sp.]MCE2952299.1 ABC transporter permease [Gemmatimonas sp.]MCZ8012640.1 ABC transporter permease [Gemmatimonas sp.]